MNRKRCPLRLFQNFSFWNSYPGFRGKTGLVAGFSRSLAKTNRVLEQVPLSVYFLTLLLLLSPFTACEQAPGLNQEEEQEQQEEEEEEEEEPPPPAQGLAERPAGGDTEAKPGSVPAGFVFVPRGTVTGSDAYSVTFAYPEGANFAGETGTQYGAFVEGRTVTIPAFYMAEMETSLGRWNTVRAWALDNGYRFASAGAGKGEDHPVTTISWRDAVVWCNAASEMDGLDPVYYRYGGTAVLRDATGGSPPNAPADRALMLWEKNGYRLPVMDEREYAARGAHPDSPEWLYWYAGSNTIDDVAWYYGTSGMGLGDPDHPDYGTHPGGEKQPNSLGIYDLSGNVMEWGWDWMHFAWNAVQPGSAQGSASRKLDPATPVGGPGYGPGASQKPMSGGSWWSSSPYSLNTFWWGFSPDYADGYVGFRVVRSW